MTTPETTWRVWRGGLSGRYYTALMRSRDDGVWHVVGRKHDVTDDIRRIIEQAIAERDGSVAS